MELALTASARLRLLGSGLAVVGVVVVLVVLVASLAGAPSALVTAVVVLGGLGVLGLGLLLGVRRWVVRLDRIGYRVRGLRAGATAARWVDVLDLQAVNSGRTRCVVLRLRDGRTTVLPVDSVEGGPVRLTALLREHLDQGRGGRRTG